MFIQNIASHSFGILPFVFNHCSLSLVLLLFQLVQGEFQRSCSQTLPKTVDGSCQLPCQCRPYPPLPPPPPPPPPPRLLIPSVSPTSVPTQKPWMEDIEILVLGSVSCASVVFLVLLVIICYKAIKRKPLRKEENGTSRGEYAMSSRSKQQVVETNNTGV
ncbi:proline-rich membrane anchor 1 [Chanos chanos]|uniref:Proline-rich membrane anchor 1 n=1 Tax=Chanos chanos TaxID=29144 RepID=A0A6J2V9Y3_CHACN|nr:proline-rich membrane anchor 1 [Chanos chanos]